MCSYKFWEGGGLGDFFKTYKMFVKFSDFPNTVDALSQLFFEESSARFQIVFPNIEEVAKTDFFLWCEWDNDGG